MEEFIKRTKASFGSLCQKPGEKRPTLVPNTEEEELVIEEWVPNTEPVFRDDNMNDTSDDEEEERLRRTSPGGMSMVLGDEEEMDAAVGVRPSIAFSSQLDREEEMDIIDLQSLQFEDRNGMDEETSRYVVEEGDDERHYEAAGTSQRTAGTSQQQQQQRDTNGYHYHHGNVGRVQGLRSVLKKSSGGGHGHGGKKHGKRVSFTGIPEPKRPYVPPFKRNGSDTKGKASVEELENEEEKQQRKQEQANVPDHVKNPGRYTRYEFDEPVVVGGGVEPVAPVGVQSQHCGDD